MIRQAKYIILNGSTLIDTFSLDYETESTDGAATDETVISLMGQPNIERLTPARVAISRLKKLKAKMPDRSKDIVLYLKVGKQDE